jgi:DNA transformation protein
MDPPQIVGHCLELLAPRGAVRARRMFGGWGLTVDGLFVALIAFDRLYLKADESSRAAFAAAGCQPFVYRSRGREITMSYWTAPAEALESADQMAPWARRALQASLAARSATVRPRRRKSRSADPVAATARTPRSTKNRSGA